MSQLLLTVYDEKGTPFELRPAKAKQLINTGWRATPPKAAAPVTPVPAAPVPPVSPAPAPASSGVTRSQPAALNQENGEAPLKHDGTPTAA